MAPGEASKKVKEEIAHRSLYSDHINVSEKPPTFKVGDIVRISKYKRAVFIIGLSRYLW